MPRDRLDPKSPKAYTNGMGNQRSNLGVSNSTEKPTGPEPRNQVHVGTYREGGKESVCVSLSQSVSQADKGSADGLRASPH